MQKVLLLAYFDKFPKGDIMKLSSLFALLATFSILTLPAFAQTAVRPNSQVEAKAAQALLDVETQMKKSSVEIYPGVSTLDKENIAMKHIAISFARLGRTQTALQTAKLISIKDADVWEGAPFTREEILRLSVRRSAALGNLENAAKLTLQIKDPSAHADALLTMARAYLREGNKKAAHNALFAVTPLIANRFEAVIYTAYLFERSGDDLAAQRLFTRAQELLPPIHLSKDPKEADDERAFSPAFRMRKSLRYYLLKAGFVDDWLRLRKQETELHSFEDYNMIDQLVKQHRTDVALDIIRTYTPWQRADQLIGIALQISREDPDEAASLLKEAVENLGEYSTSANAHKINPGAIQQYRDSMLVFIASTYYSIGKKEEADRLMQQAIKGATPREGALLRIQYTLFPLFINKTIFHENNFSHEKLFEINNKVNAYLSGISINEEVFNYLQQLIEAQIQAGQLSDARQNIGLIEKYALKTLQSAKDSNDFNSAMSVARFWKQAKAPKRSHRILQTIFDTPVKTKKLRKIDRAYNFIAAGFVDEGLQFVASLPKDHLKSNTTFVRPIYYEMAKAHPSLFPKKMLLQDKAPREQVQALWEFAKGITWDVFHAPGEQELELFVGNGYSAGG